MVEEGVGAEGGADAFSLGSILSSQLPPHSSALLSSGLIMNPAG